MRHTCIWIVEFIKFLAGRRLHPLSTQCPICGGTIRLHVNNAGRRHLLAHARRLFEGSRFSVHYASKTKCPGSGAPIDFDPRPNEHQHFKIPVSLVEE